MRNNLFSIYKFNTLYIVFITLWGLVNSELLGDIDGAGRILFGMNVLALLINAPKIKRLPIVTLIYFIWIVYVIINTSVKGFEVSDPMMWCLRRLLTPLVTMMVTYNLCIEKFEKTISVFYYLMIAFVVLGSFFITRYENYDGAIRVGNKLGNDYANHGVQLAFFTSLMFALKKIKFNNVLLVYIFLAVMLVLLASRKSFSCYMIFVMFTIIGAYSRSKKGNILFWLIPCLLLFIIVESIVSYTQLGLRFSYLAQSDDYNDDLFLQLMGDRAIQYVESWDMFISSPLTGIGLLKFTVNNSFFEGLPLHSEYMVQLAECGIIGTALFCMFYFMIIKNNIFTIKHATDSFVSIMIFAGTLSVIILNFTAWTYTSSFVFEYFAITCAYYSLQKNYLTNKKSIIQ